MNDKFLAGVVLGMLGGALIVTNSVKARQTVKNGQQQVMEKIDNMTKSSKSKSKQEE